MTKQKRVKNNHNQGQKPWKVGYISEWERTKTMIQCQAWGGLQRTIDKNA
jgi:hypothetical protein